MSGVQVYGASDDLVELEGDIREEFTGSATDDSEGALLAFSDGTVLRVRYTEAGVWRITPVAVGRAFIGIDQAPEDDESNYSDRASLREGVMWAVFGTGVAVAKSAKKAVV